MMRRQLGPLRLACGCIIAGQRCVSDYRCISQQHGRPVSAVKAIHHSRSDTDCCSYVSCNQLKGAVIDQSNYQECDQVCDQSHHYEESEKGQIIKYEPK
eukprot:3219389-Amphidinium_carterae.1